MSWTEAQHVTAARSRWDLYRELLGRDPDPDGDGAYAYLQRERGWTHGQVRDSLLASDEYRDRHAPAPPVPEPPGPGPAPGWRPSRDEIRRWRSDFLGRWNRPLFVVGGMSADERREQYRWMHEHGYTHVPLAVHNDYPVFSQWHWDWWGDPGTLRMRLEELYAEQLVPVVVLHPKPELSIADHLERVRVLWSAIGDLVVALSWGWEINDLQINGHTSEWGNGSAQLRYLEGLRSIVGGEVLIYVHFTPERWSGWPGFDGQEQGRGEIDWLREARLRGVVGLLYQDDPHKHLDEVMDRALRITSPHRWLPGIIGRVQVGAGLDFIAFEWSRDEDRHAEGVRVIEADGRAEGYAED